MPYVVRYNRGVFGYDYLTKTGSRHFEWTYDFKRCHKFRSKETAQREARKTFEVIDWKLAEQEDSLA
jgi:hypothetical protein